MCAASLTTIMGRDEGGTHRLPSGCYSPRSVPDRPVGAVVDPLSQVLAGLEMRHVLARQRHCLAGLGITALPRRPEVQRERAEATYLDAISRRQGIAHDL